MAQITEDTINRIRNSSDIVEVISSYISLTQKGKNHFGVCPFHDDHSPSMSVSSEKQIYKCFSCGATGNVITFVQNFNSISFIEALTILGEKIGIKIDSKPVKKKDDELLQYINIYSTVNSFYKNNLLSKEGSFAREYLKKRGIEREVIDYFDIGLSLDNKLSLSLSKKYEKRVLLDIDIAKEGENGIFDTFKNRIMFPIKNLDNDIVAFSGRIYKPSDDAKYVNTKETKIFKKSSILYNLSNAKEYIRKEKEIIICEGFLDVIRLHTIGIKNAVALMGTSFTTEQLSIISKLRVNVVLNLDQDNPGKDASISIGDTLQKESISTTVIVFNEYKDTDEYILNNGAEDFLKAYRNKISFIDFKLNYLKSKKNLKDSVQISKFLNEAIESLNNIDDDILRELKLKELSKEFEIDESVLRSKIKIKTENITPLKRAFERKEMTKKMLNKYDKSQIRLLYLMINYEDVLLIYENSLGYMIDEEYKNLSGEILTFKYKYKYFNLSEFMDFIRDKDNIKTTLEFVMSNNEIDEYSEEELEDYINTIKEYSVKRQIDILKDKMKSTIDINEKISIAKRIENMKKEVLKW